jgi:hypothetical protein
VAFAILSFHCAHDFAQGLKDGCGELRDVDPPAKAPGLEASQASNGGDSASLVYPSRGLFSASRRGFPIIGALDQRMPVEMRSSGGQPTFRFVLATPPPPSPRR